MRGRVDQPGSVQAHRYAEEYAPKQERPAPNRRQQHAQNNKRYVVILRQKHMKRILDQVRSVSRAFLELAVARVSNQHPYHVRPPLAVVGCVRIAMLIRELMMHTV